MAEAAGDRREGGCLCGAVRYSVDLTDHEIGVCHCRDCQKQSGTAFMMFTLVAKAQFQWISPPTGDVSISDKAVRRFCIKCGTPIVWQSLDPEEANADVNFSTATLDDTSDTKVSYELYTRSRMPGIQPFAESTQHVAEYVE